MARRSKGKGSRKSGSNPAARALFKLAKAGGGALPFPANLGISLAGAVVEIASGGTVPIDQAVAAIKADHALQEVRDLKEVLLLAAGVIPGQRSTIELAAEAAEDPEGCQENELLRQAMAAVFDQVGVKTDDLAELDARAGVASLQVSGPGAVGVADFRGADMTDATVIIGGGASDEPPSTPAPTDEVTVSHESGHYIRPGSQTIVDPFCGRGTELHQLHAAVDAEASIICVVGMAGEGKSSLLGQWYKTGGTALKDKAVFWCRPYESGYTFARFLGEVLPWLTDGGFDPGEYRTTREQAELLCSLLRDRPVMVVLDGVERWLKRWTRDPDAEAPGTSADDRAGTEDGLDLLFEDASAWMNGSALIMTTRALPIAMEGRPVVRIGSGATHHEALGALDDEAAVELLKELGVEGNPKDILKAANEYDNHALTLAVLGHLLGREYGGDVSKRPKVDPVGDDREKKIGKLLAKVEKHHEANLRLMRHICCCLCPAPVEMLASLLKIAEKETRRRLSDLADWQLVRFDGRTGEAHALIRRYFSGGLKEKQKRDLLLAIARWFASRPLGDQPQALDEVMPLVQGAQHALEGRDVDLAADYLYSAPAGKHHETLDDWLQAFGYLTLSVQLDDRVVELYEQLIESEGHKELRNELAGTYSNRGNALQAQGDLAGAVGDYDKAIEIRKQLVENEGRKELRNDLASAYNNRGIALRAQGDLAGAVADYDKAIETRKQLVENEGRKDLRNNLASAYNNRGLALEAQGDLAGAVGDYNKAVEIYSQLVDSEGRKEVRNDLAAAYNNRGNALQAQGDLAGAVADYDKAIKIREQLVESEGRTELRNNLASAYNNRGLALIAQGDLGRAVVDYDKAIEIYKQLVEREGRKELRNDLASAYSNRGGALATKEEFEGALEDSRTGIDIMEQLVQKEGRGELIGYLAKYHGMRGTILRLAGRSADAWESFASAADLLDPLVSAGRRDLLPVLLNVTRDLVATSAQAGRDADSAQRADKTVAMLKAVVDTGQVTSILQESATDFFGSVTERLEPLANAGLDIESFAEVAGALGMLKKGKGGTTPKGTNTERKRAKKKAPKKKAAKKKTKAKRRKKGSKG